MNYPARVVDLPYIELRRKGEWKGFLAWCVAFGIWLGELVRIRAATRFMDDFYTVIGPRLYIPRGKDPAAVGVSIVYHERTHRHQQLTNRAHALRYMLSRKYRRAAESQAYALEVAHFDRNAESAARSMSDPIYAMGLDTAAARAMIDRDVEAWRSVPFE